MDRGRAGRRHRTDRRKDGNGAGRPDRAADDPGRGAGGDWSKIRIVQAEPSPDFKRLGTGGSFSVAGLWTPLRIAGAAAREMLIAAAAAKWGVDAATCIARDSVVVHPPSGRRAPYGELAAAAAKLPVPKEPPLRSVKDFRLVGTSSTAPRSTASTCARSAPPSADELKKPEVCQDLSWGVYDIAYAIPSIETAYAPVPIPVKHGPWRAVFSPGSTFARESFIDEVAHALRKDPVALRLELLAGDDVLSAGDGDAMLKIDRRRLRRVISLAAEKSGWGRRAGLGFACNVYDGSTHIAYVVEMKGTQVERVVAAVDCGQVINPTGVEQQIEGGIIWALSQALKGSITFRDGRAEQTRFVDYEVARLRDAPKIEVHIVKNEDAPPSGMGEPPVPPLAPAVANAIFAATGKRIRRLPLA